MKDIKKQARKLMEKCEAEGLAVTIAISDPNDNEEAGFLGNTGPVYCVLANLAGIFLATEKDIGIHIDQLMYDVRKAAKKYEKTKVKK